MRQTVRRRAADGLGRPRALSAALVGLALWATGCARTPAMLRPEEAPAIARPSGEWPVCPAPGTGPAASRRVEIGRSVEGRPLVLEVFGTGPRAVLVLGGIHGDEPTSAALAGRLAELLREQPGLARGATVAILAAANPDGLRRGTRTNARGIDLNRNFPAKNWRPGGRSRYDGGPAPASEPETRAILRAIELVGPRCIVSVHSASPGRHGNNYDGPAAGLAQRMAEANGYPVLATMGYPTPGSLGSWAGVDRALPILTLELPRNLPADAAWEANRDAVLTVLEESPEARLAAERGSGPVAPALSPAGGL